MNNRPRFLEFFAGGGLARMGLGDSFECVFANDIDAMKCAAYRRNFPSGHLVEGDIWRLDAAALPNADLAWASFPCQDLSLAGARKGLNAPRSGAFWGFWNLVEAMQADGRAPRVLALENVTGLLSSRRGRDFHELVGRLADAGYRVGAMVIDAVLFTPQSRPRLFIVAINGRIPEGLTATAPDALFHPPALQAAVEGLSHDSRLAWEWWRLPAPPRRNSDLAAVLERRPPDDVWRSEAALDRLVAQMAPLHRARFEAARAESGWRAGAVYRRIRLEGGAKVQRAEIRYDGLAGCLRTPAGGSSKQLLVVTEAGRARLRPLMAREAARLMGAPDDYELPEAETAALKVLGDAVCAPAVAWLGKHLLAPLIAGRAMSKRAGAEAA